MCCQRSTGYHCHGRPDARYRQVSTLFIFLDLQATHLGELWYRGNVILRVTDALDKDRFRLVIDGFGKVCRVVSVDELDADIVIFKGDCRKIFQRFVWRAQFDLVDL